jgi:hypothetical protein
MKTDALKVRHAWNSSEIDHVPETSECVVIAKYSFKRRMLELVSKHKLVIQLVRYLSS